MSMFRKFMDSKFMDIVEVIGDTTVEVLKGMAEITTEVLVDTFNQGNNNESYVPSNEDLTRNYLEGLSYDEIESYYDNNEYLNRYGENYKYSNKDQFIKSICEITRKENRSFVDKYNRY